MKTNIFFLVISLLFLSNGRLLAQSWTNGGNSLTANGSFGSNNNFSVIFKTNNTERGRVTTAGFWGIGTTSPQSRLHFTGDLTTNWETNFYHYEPTWPLNQKKVWLRRQWNGSLGDYLMLGSTGNRSNTEQSAIVLATNGVFLGRGKEDGIGLSREWMRIDANGNVGIGTLSPAARLEVSRDNFLVAKFTNSAITGDRTALIDIQNGQGVLWRYGVGGAGNGMGLTNGQFYIERGGIGPVLTITSAGNVGIGTKTPDSYYKLSVKGPIRAHEIRINTGWADYVFAKDYDLKPLSEVEQYINKNKHLPDVPSAAEVAQNGINVGEMNAILLRKIEELTLHMIDLKKENDRMKTRMEQLATEVEQR